MNLSETLERLLRGRDLTEEQAEATLEALTGEPLDPALAGAILVALRAKGETANEVRGFARRMRALALPPDLPPDLPAADVVGTGGDGSGSVNLSTGSALLAAACGVPVMKHGNRSVSSRSGSADLLEALGLSLPLDRAAAARCLDATGFTFLFAPHYHPAMKQLAAVRRSLGVRTVFNVLGPLTNPAAPPFGLIGAFSRSVARLMAEALSEMEIKRVFVVHGEPGWDEPTPVGAFDLFDVRRGRVDASRRDPRAFGLARCKPEALAGGDAAQNAERLRDVFEHGEKGAHRDALMLGAALVLEVSGRVAGPEQGLALAAAALDDGRAARVLHGLEQVAGTKR